MDLKKFVMKYKFDLIKNIDTDKESTWKGKIFLTFDVDWASEEVWLHTIKILELYDVPATWFVTHESPLISRILKNPKFSVGIHPNFNPLINSFSNSKVANQIIDDFDKFLPRSKLLRSHSLFQSERLLDVFNSRGYEFICNSFIPINENQLIAPYRLWDNIKIVPHCWQDNVSLKMNLKFPNELDIDQLIVLDFHPIHVFLNSENLDRYENSRKFHSDYIKLKEMVNNGYGIKSILINLIQDNL